MSLETAILNILDTAHDLDLQSISMPALLVKSKDFPISESAEVMIFWIIEWCHLP